MMTRSSHSPWRALWHSAALRRRLLPSRPSRRNGRTGPSPDRSANSTSANPARLQGLPRSLPDLSLAEARRLPHVGQAGALGLLRRRRTRSLPTIRSTTDRTRRARCSSGRAGCPTISPIRPNEQALRSRFRGALPVDLSIIAKARTYEVGFPDFLFDIFRQYQENGVDYLARAAEPVTKRRRRNTKLTPVQSGTNISPVMRSRWSSRSQDGQVDYTDGTPQTVEQYARDVTAFLVWAAEPFSKTRKRIGFQVMIFLIVFAGLIYFTKKKIWSDAH